MRRLLLLRHAKTEPDAASGKDFDRRLDERGEIDAAAIGHWIARQGPSPDLALISTAIRAQQSWDIVAASLPADGTRLPAAHLPALYGAGPTELLGIIRDADDAVQRLLVVGHNPGLHELALALVGDGAAADRKEMADNLPTSGLAVIDFAIDAWDQVSFRAGRLENFITPKLLKQVPKM